jgi:adenylate kinase family enzyme
MVARRDKRFKAILLIGPTGAGKTPLGQLLEKRGLKGKRCIHFDFGNALRKCVADPDSRLTRDEIRIVGKSLATGALLEDKDFIIAEKLLLDFIRERRAGGNSFVVLNGLPRHAGQARAIERFIDMRLLVKLDCPLGVVLARIQMDTGGDRSGRTDDALDEVEQRVKLFKKRTEPLIDYYRGMRVPLLSIDIKAKSTAQEMYRQIETW